MTPSAECEDFGSGQPIAITLGHIGKIKRSHIAPRSQLFAVFAVNRQKPVGDLRTRVIERPFGVLGITSATFPSASAVFPNLIGKIALHGHS